MGLFCNSNKKEIEELKREIRDLNFELHKIGLDWKFGILDKIRLKREDQSYDGIYPQDVVTVIKTQTRERKFYKSTYFDDNYQLIVNKGDVITYMDKGIAENIFELITDKTE